MDTLNDNYEYGARSSSRTSLNIKIPQEADTLNAESSDFIPNYTYDVDPSESHIEVGVPFNTTRTVSPEYENQKPRTFLQMYSPLQQNEKPSPIQDSNYRPSKNSASDKVGLDTLHTYLNADSKQINSGSNITLESKNISRRDQQKRAVMIIERAWMSYRNKQMFKLLKNSVCAAENSLSYEILRKVSPKEAEFFSHKNQQIRIRFRFGGEEFPPMIFFKIYIQTGVQKVKYLSGRKMIKPATEASVDALKQMGNRNFYNLMLQDAIRQQSHPVTDEVDITTLKDYMQYLSNLDESPANQGGKENYWRKLTLNGKDLPRHTIFFDVLDFAYNNHLSQTLKGEMQLLTARPVTQMMLVKQFKSIAQIRSQQSNAPTHYFKSSKSNSMFKDHSQTSGRQTKQAREKAMRMRQLYSQQYETDEVANVVDDDDYIHYGQDGENELLDDVSDEDWDQEAHQLYQWTQGLSFSDDLTHPTLMT